MIERLLPPQVVAVEALADPPDAALLPEEEAAVARAVDKRRREFTTARYCARLCLARLGLPAAALIPGDGGAPQWPPGAVGSMTHCEGYRAAAVGHSAEVLTVGIDAEPHESLPGGVLGLVSLPAERDMLGKLAATDPGTHWGRILFSAKESVYKAWFPLTGRWLGFEQAEIEIDDRAGSFATRLLVPGPVAGGQRLAGFTGRWLVSGHLVITAVAVLRHDLLAPGGGPAVVR